jgi:two-component system sensor histidine kinase AlgZ
MAVTALVGGVLVAVVFFDVGRETPPAEAIEGLVIAVLFSGCIAALAHFVVPRVAPAIFARFGAPLNWIVLALALIPVSVVGSAVGTTVLVILGYLPASSFLPSLIRTAQIAPVVTLTFGVLVSAYEMLQSQLDQTKLALRTKERDETEARRLATAAQLASLESLIRPHFLFNTLNSITSLIPTDPLGAERMTTQLAALLRASLDAASEPLVPLDQEIMMVRTYLEIEQVRLRERLRFEIAVAADAQPESVPRLSLQTLVENSVKHAVAPRREGGVVRVAARRSGTRLLITVGDDGPGFAATASPPGHGLALLRERIAVLYSGDAALRVDAAHGNTTVTLDLPARGAPTGSIQ